MKNLILQKTFLSPFLGTLFAAIAITGVLLFFHIKNGPIVVVHEWLGVVFAVVGLIHIILNLRQFASYLKLGRSWIAILIALALIILFSFAGLHHPGGSHGPERTRQANG